VHELTGDEVALSAHLGAGHEADLPTTLALRRKLPKHMPKEVVVLFFPTFLLSRTRSCYLHLTIEACIPALRCKLARSAGTLGTWNFL
jgi:hypothetical protein